VRAHWSLDPFHHAWRLTLKETCLPVQGSLFAKHIGKEYGQTSHEAKKKCHGDTRRHQAAPQKRVSKAASSTTVGGIFRAIYDE
jgi:hypothetical protein